jgi:hypothetical protein
VEELCQAVAAVKFDYGSPHGTIRVLTADSQADSTIARRLLNGTSHLVMTTDSDFVAYAGEHALLVAEWKVEKATRQTRATISNIVLKSGFAEPMEKAASILHQGAEVFIHKPELPIFF